MSFKTKYLDLQVTLKTNVRWCCATLEANDMFKLGVLNISLTRYPKWSGLV
jgi:hypothetical protein